MFEVYMGVVTGDTSEMCIGGVVASAVGHPVRLKTYVVDAPEVGHHPYRVRTSVTRATELLRERIGIEFRRIENI